MKSRFQMSSMGELTFFLGLQVKQKEDGIFISQDKYVAEILKKFDFAGVKTASTPIETQKPLVKDEESSDVDVHLYRSMIGSLMYLTAFRPDIMFAVCACSRFQVNPKTSHLSVVKRIFRYLKGKPKLGLWYPRVSSFDLEAYSDSDYAGANLDRKSTIGGCQFLGRRLISWQCKKQTIVATSTTEAEYVAAANCCGQVLWIQNQMLDYGFNFMNTKIYIDNESTICIVKNPVYHSKTKHIVIQHHFIRDAYEKKLIQVIKIHTDDNVPDLLTKAFDVSRFQFLSLGRDKDGIEALLLPNLFILALTIVSTDSVKLIPLGKDSTAIETLKKIPLRGKAQNLICFYLVQPPEDEGTTSERPSEPQPTPSPSHPSEATIEPQFLVGIKEVKHLKEQIKKLKKNAKPVITHHRAWMKSVSLKQRLAGKKSLKSNWMQKESVSKQGRKSAKAEPSVHKDLLFDELPRRIHIARLSPDRPNPSSPTELQDRRRREHETKFNCISDEKVQQSILHLIQNAPPRRKAPVSSCRTKAIAIMDKLTT
ncbi:putative ribonuclease H-like domain-containing protein [Tanacetum coccineum]